MRLINSTLQVLVCTAVTMLVFLSSSEAAPIPKEGTDKADIAITTDLRQPERLKDWKRDDVNKDKTTDSMLVKRSFWPAVIQDEIDKQIHQVKWSEWASSEDEHEGGQEGVSTENLDAVEI